MLWVRESESFVVVLGVEVNPGVWWSGVRYESESGGGFRN